MTDEGRRILAFYEGSAPDDRGRFLRDILGFDDAALERTHDFIQWLFPLRERSGANPSAPRLDDDAVEAFAKRAELREALGRSLDRMLEFYGLQWDGDRIVAATSFEQRRAWLTPGNHHHLRLTRMLIALRTLGLATTALALADCLFSIARRPEGRAIPQTTLRYWQQALR